MKKRIFTVAFLAILLGFSRPAPAAEIHDAVRAGDLAKVKALVANDSQVVNDKEAGGETPLHYASYSGHFEIVAFLIANKADVKAADRDGFTPLHYAASAGFLSLVDYLIAREAAAKKLPSRVICPEIKGDRVHLF